MHAVFCLFITRIKNAFFLFFISAWNYQCPFVVLFRIHHTPSSEISSASSILPEPSRIRPWMASLFHLCIILESRRIRRPCLPSGFRFSHLPHVACASWSSLLLGWVPLEACFREGSRHTPRRASSDSCALSLIVFRNGSSGNPTVPSIQRTA